MWGVLVGVSASCNDVDYKECNRLGGHVARVWLFAGGRGGWPGVVRGRAVVGERMRERGCSVGEGEGGEGGGGEATRGGGGGGGGRVGGGGGGG